MTGAGREGAGGPSPLRFVGLGLEMVAPLLVGLYVGRRLDAWLGTHPWLLLAGTLLGMAAGFLAFFRTVLPRGDGGGGERG